MDIGAATAIHKALIELRDQGAAILVVSEDIDELFQISDRIGALCQGRLSPIKPTPQTSINEVGRWMAGEFESARQWLASDCIPRGETMIKLEPRGQHSRLMAWFSPVLAGVLTLISGAILFGLLGQDPAEALYTLLIAPVSDTYGVAELCVKAAPILLCATGLSLVFRAQVWNIGAEGQLLMGGLIGSYCALLLIDVEGVWVLPTVLLAGMAGGALWAALAAWLKTAFNANEILTTIMLNYIALNLLIWAVHGPLKDPEGFNFPESAMFSDSALLPVLVDGTRIHLGMAFALLAVVVIWVLLSRSFLGFQIKVLGLDSSAAPTGRIPGKATGVDRPADQRCPRRTGRGG